MTIYVASPYGFSEAGRAFYYHNLIPLLASQGHVIIDPWHLTDPTRLAHIRGLPPGAQRREAWECLNADIGGANASAIARADAMLAILDGSDVDSGTASEIGYAFARGKPILGYRGDFRLASDNEGAPVNLQVTYFIHASGGQVIHSVQQIPEALTCLRPKASAPS